LGHKHLDAIGHLMRLLHRTAKTLPGYSLACDVR
jgi:hypothetical protein